MASNSVSATLHLQALSQAGFITSLRSVDDATGASNSVVRQKREERKRCVHTLLKLSHITHFAGSAPSSVWHGSGWSVETWRLSAAQAEMLEGACQPAAHLPLHVSIS